MKKKLWHISAVLATLVLLCFCAACTQQPQTLTELILEANNLRQLTAEGELKIQIDDAAMEEDLAEAGLPPLLFKDTTVKYQIACDNDNHLAKIELETAAACLEEPLFCTFYLTHSHIYLNAQDFMSFYQLCSMPEEYAKALRDIGDTEWLDIPLEQEMSSYSAYSEMDFPMILEDMEKLHNTVGKAYADFEFDGLKASGNGFELDLDNAGLAQLINDFMYYSLDNYEAISLAYIAYINSSVLFDEYDREQLTEAFQSLGEYIEQITPLDRMGMAVAVEQALTKDCPIDFAFKYSFAKTDIDTYKLNESLSLLFDEEYFGAPTPVYISLQNITKAASGLQIDIPTEKVSSIEDL